MRLFSLLVAFSVIDTSAFAFTRSKVQHLYLEGRHNRMNVVTASHQQLTQLSETSVSDERSVSTVDFSKIQGRIKQTVGISASAIIASIILATSISGPAFADEYGVEKEAPTLFTGETVEVCTNNATSGSRLLVETF